MQPFLRATEIIDFHESAVWSTAKALTKDTRSDTEIARNCFEYVRDEKPAFMPAEGEFDLMEKLSDPLDVVVDALQRYGSYAEIVANFPDVG